MYILIKNQEGENMNLLSQNTDFNALLAAMKADIEAEYEKATGSAINLDEDSGSDYEVGINVEDSAADGFCLASGYMYGADSNFDWGIFKVKSQKSNLKRRKIMSPTNDMKARLFVDMDGTLAVWKQAACFEDLLQPGYFRDLPPYQTVLDAVKILCNTKPELDVYALSAYMPENPYAVHEKNAWLDAYLPEIDSEHRIFVACGSSKARAAANRLKTPCIDSSFVLLDDYSVNLHEWKANRGSCIKLRNGINGNGGTWKGESVTRFDTAENIADRIWSIIKKTNAMS